MCCACGGGELQYEESACEEKSVEETESSSKSMPIMVYIFIPIVIILAIFCIACCCKMKKRQEKWPVEASTDAEMAKLANPTMITPS